MKKRLPDSVKGLIKLVAVALGTLLLYFVAKAICGKDNYLNMIVCSAFIYSLVAYSISVMLGMGGELSFAGVAFMGGGGFLVANLTTGRLGVQIGTIPAFLLIIPVFAIIAFIIGLILLRLKGTFFTFSTIALVQMTYTIYNNYKELFGGADGISGVPTTVLFGKKLFFYADWLPVLLIISVVVGLIVSRIRSTPLGRSLASCRDNETAARTLGVNVYLTKVIAFTIAGVLSAMAGGLYTMLMKFVSADMFTYASSTKYVIMAMLGGVQSTAGAFFGAIIVQVLPQLLKAFERYFQLFWGVAIVLLMVFMPEGIAGIVKSTRYKLRSNRKKKTAAANTKEGV